MKTLNSVNDIKTYADLVEFYDADLVLNNEIINHFDFDVESGELYDEELDEYTEIYQYYVITPYFADTLEHVCPDQIVLYNNDLDMYLWGISHCGSSWDIVPVSTVFN